MKKQFIFGLVLITILIIGCGEEQMSQDQQEDEEGDTRNDAAIESANQALLNQNTTEADTEVEDDEEETVEDEEEICNIFPEESQYKLTNDHYSCQDLCEDYEKNAVSVSGVEVIDIVGAEGSTKTYYRMVSSEFCGIEGWMDPLEDEESEIVIFSTTVSMDERQEKIDGPPVLSPRVIYADDDSLTGQGFMSPAYCICGD